MMQKQAENGVQLVCAEEKDAELIANYRKPAYVLKGWEPLSYIKK